MSFIDEDLKSLKEGNWTHVVHPGDLKNLIERLEAAEKVCRMAIYYKEHGGIKGHGLDSFIEEWLKSKGEGKKA